jgi:MerR family redox-sensitive transcriptional activator SoxR
VLYLSIGELARQSGTRPSALRYYESLGLLPPADREGGRRQWPAATLRRLALIKMSQRAGFTLAEIGQLLDSETGRGATRQWRAFAERKLPDIDRAIKENQILRNAVAACLACGCMNFQNCELLSDALVPESSPPPSA